MNDELISWSNSRIVMTESKLADCYWCNLKSRHLRNFPSGFLAKPNGEMVCVAKFHHDQEQNISSLIYHFKKFIQKMDLNINLTITQENGHYLLS